MHGVLVIDKPTGVSSAWTVEQARRQLGADRAGHGGTLDPLATGVLAVCIGSATKLAQFLLADDKAYEADGVLGVETDTLDRTGRETASRPLPADAADLEARLRAALEQRTGAQQQVPPMYSALKQGGVPLYKRARAGEEVERAPRQIHIARLALLAFEPPRFRIAIECSKGTYVRSLVADLGADVGLGAHLAELRRTRSGRFSLAQAVTLANVSPAALVPVEQATLLPSVTVRADLVPYIFNGVQMGVGTWGDPAPAGQFQLVDEAGRLLAVAHAHEDGRTVYDRVFPELSGVRRT